METAILATGLFFVHDKHNKYDESIVKIGNMKIIRIAAYKPSPKFEP